MHANQLNLCEEVITLLNAQFDVSDFELFEVPKAESRHANLSLIPDLTPLLTLTELTESMLSSLRLPPTPQTPPQPSMSNSVSTGQQPQDQQQPAVMAATIPIPAQGD